MTPLFKRARNITLLACLFSNAAWAGYYPMYASWDQPNGPGLDMTLTYSFSNLFNGDVVDANGQPFSIDIMRSAFEQAFTDYATVLPIHFIEVADAGPLPETGEYDPTGLANIRIGVVPLIDDANAYAYFPQNTATSGLAGDVVFNGERFGLGWSPIFFYAVAQHELGHSLGMGHYHRDNVCQRRLQRPDFALKQPDDLRPASGLRRRHWLCDATICRAGTWQQRIMARRLIPALC